MGTKSQGLPHNLQTFPFAPRFKAYLNEREKKTRTANLPKTAGLNSTSLMRD